jgi:predicted small metal-binding protein
MTLELRCGDVVPGCDGVVRADTREEVLAQAASHAAAAHGITTIDAATEQALEAAIHETASG